MPPAPGGGSLAQPTASDWRRLSDGAIVVAAVTIRNILHQSAADFSGRFGKLPPQICEYCEANLLTEVRNV